MNEPKLFGQPELTEAEEDEALMAFNSANDVSGRWRKKKIGAFAESLHRENALAVVWDDTTLFEDYSSPSTQFERASTTTIFHASETHNLDIKSGVNRHSFADGYTHFVFYVNGDSTPDARRDAKFIVIAPEVVDSSEASPARLGVIDFSGNKMLAITKSSNTSFKTGFAVFGNNDGTDTTIGIYLTKIVGYKQIIRPSSL